MTTIETITNEQIKALCMEAAAAGDWSMVDTCKRALPRKPGGEVDLAAITFCVEVIRAAEAMSVE